MIYMDNVCEFYAKSAKYGFGLLEGKDFTVLKGPHEMEYLSLVLGEYSSENFCKINQFLEGLPYCWFVNKDETHIGKELVRHGFRADVVDPVMVMDLATYIPSLETNIRIEPVRNEAMLDEWASIAEKAYEMPKEGFRRFSQIAAKEEREDIKAFIGYNSQGKAVATSMVHIGSEVGAIYWISVLKEYRRRGIGADMTRVCINHAKRQNTVKSIFLQSFPDGISLYEKLGFRVVNSLAHYWPKGM